MGGNIFYPNALIVARYDDAKGGRQQVPVFGQMSVTIERVASDEVRLDNGESATFTRFAFYIATQQIIFWRDAADLAAIQSRFEVHGVRPESAVAADVDGAADWWCRRARVASGIVGRDLRRRRLVHRGEVTLPVASYSLAGTLLVEAWHAPSGRGDDHRFRTSDATNGSRFPDRAIRTVPSDRRATRVERRRDARRRSRHRRRRADARERRRRRSPRLRGRRSRVRTPASNRIVVIGHSEGASIAAMIGASDPKLAAVVTMAGVAKRGADVSFEQQEDMLRSARRCPKR